MPPPFSPIEPAFDEHAVAIAFTCNQVFVPFMSVTLQTVLERATPGHRYDIVVLHTDITPVRQAALLTQIGDRENVSLRFFDAAERFAHYGMDRWPSRPPYNGASYVQLLIPVFCARFDRVLALHGDLLVQADPADLFYTDLDGHPLGVVPNQVIADQLERSRDFRHYYRQELAFESPETTVFNPAVLLFDNRVILRDDLMESMLRKGPRPNNRQLEEEMLNVFFRGRVKFLDTTWNLGWTVLFPGDEFVTMDERARTALALEARIIHLEGAALRAERIATADCALPWWQAARKSPFYEQLLHAIDADKWVLRNDFIRALGVRARLKRYLSTMASLPLRLWPGYRTPPPYTPLS